MNPQLAFRTNETQFQSLLQFGGSGGAAYCRKKWVHGVSGFFMKFSGLDDERVYAFRTGITYQLQYKPSKWKRLELIFPISYTHYYSKFHEVDIFNKTLPAVVSKWTLLGIGCGFNYQWRERIHINLSYNIETQNVFELFFGSKYDWMPYTISQLRTLRSHYIATGVLFYLFKPTNNSLQNE